MSSFHQLVKDNHDELMDAFQRVLQRRGLAKDIALKEIHFVPAEARDRNCRQVRVCRRVDGRTVCTTETQCD